MSKDEREIESAVLEALAAKIGTDRLTMWFTGDTQLAWTGEKLVVSTGDEFTASRIRRNFVLDLRDIITTIAGPQAKVEIELLGESPLGEKGVDALPLSQAQPLPLTASPASFSTRSTAPSMRSTSSSAAHGSHALRVASPSSARSDASRTSAQETIEKILKSAGTSRAAAKPTTHKPSSDSSTSSSPAAAANISAESHSGANNSLDSNPAASSAAEMIPAEKLRWTRRPFARLDSFVEGDGNRIALSAAKSVLPRLGKMSPLVFSGPPGCGKTHLLEGIWSHARHHSSLKRVVYLTAEQFTTHFVEALRGSGLPSFRKKYRDVELLLIDDIQFFAGKQSTLTELLYTIETLLREGRQLVLAADRPLSQLRMLGADVVNRLGGGLVCTIDPADFGTRRGILERLAIERSVVVPSDVLDWLAASLEGDARLLSGAMNRLAATAEMSQKALTLESAEAALSDLLGASRRAVRMNDIVGAVCNMFGLEPDSLQSSSKSPAISHPRMLAMWLARKYTRAALSEIGRNFGRRSHTTVLSAQSKVTRWLAEGKRVSLSHGDCTVEDALRRLESQLRAS